jgi:prepilin-type N-terminal cleavage/methylation domain-containing protein
MRSDGGFTLIELLVVVAILATLAALLFPVFSQARLSACNSQDLQQIRQVNLASVQYCADNEDRFVPAGAPAADYSWSPARNPFHDAAGRPWNGWGLKLAAYARDRAVFRSPVLPERAAFEGDCRHAADMPLTSTYAVNWLLHRDGSYSATDDPGYDRTPSGIPLVQPITTTEISSPASTVSLMLTSCLPPYGRDWGCLFMTLEASDFINRILFSAAYRDGGNLALADGHARYFRLKEADSGKNAAIEVYHLPKRSIWIQPTMPDDTLGYRNLGLG